MQTVLLQKSVFTVAMWRDEILRRRINASAHNTNLSHFHQASERKRGRQATHELLHPYKRPKTEESQLSCEGRQNLSSVGSGALNRVPENRSARFILESIMLEASRRRTNLLDWYKRTVTVDADDKKRSVSVVCHTLRTIMDNVRSQDGGYFYSANLLKAGSYAVKTKIGKADEFDWLLPLNATAQTYKRRFSVSILKVVTRFKLFIFEIDILAILLKVSTELKGGVWSEDAGKDVNNAFVILL